MDGSEETAAGQGTKTEIGEVKCGIQVPEYDRGIMPVISGITDGNEGYISDTDVEDVWSVDEESTSMLP